MYEIVCLLVAVIQACMAGFALHRYLRTKNATDLILCFAHSILAIWIISTAIILAVQEGIKL